MKRLKNKFLSMQLNTSTYSEMYDGQMTVSDPGEPWTNPWVEYDPTYYYEDIGFRITGTHKLAQDKPTITVIIPCHRLGIESFNEGVADLCLRELKPYIGELNDELYNRSRPDCENGKYYLYSPNGKILVRNTSYFAICKQKDYENGAGSCVLLLPPNTCPPCMCLNIMMQVQLPRNKLRKAMQMLCRDLPCAIERFVSEFDIRKMKRACDVYEKQAKIRAWLKNSDYCAFLANGSVLPRKKGTDLPMENAIPFKSTPNDEIELFGVRGMGIKRGMPILFHI